MTLARNLILGVCGLAVLGYSLASAGVNPSGSPVTTLRLSRGAADREMPPFTLPSLEGQTVRSADLNGKVVVLNFWATWCGPCKEEMPALERLRKQFDGRDVAVVTITTDHQRDGIAAFMKHLGLSLPVLLDESRDVSDSYMVRGLPTTVILGRNGRVFGRAVGPRDWDGPDAVALIDRLRKE